MSKRIEPVMGEPVGEALGYISHDVLERTNNSDNMAEISRLGALQNVIMRIFELVNQDVCLTQWQRELMQDVIVQKAQRFADHAVTILPLINSFRLDCENCLNGKCKKRDPEKPVPEVKKEEEQKDQ